LSFTHDVVVLAAFGVVMVLLAMQAFSTQE
jgi:hypothetical protein